MAADRTHAEMLGPTAGKLAETLGGHITLCRFEVRTELETFRPPTG